MEELKLTETLKYAEAVERDMKKLHSDRLFKN